MSAKPSRTVKVNLPLPGETKAQFMTRSVRILMKSGKSKQDAIGIAEKVWNNVSQMVNITPNQTDTNVVYTGQVNSPQGGSPGSVSVRQMSNFSQLSSKLDRANQNTNVNQQAQFFNNLQNILNKNLSPLADIARNQNRSNISSDVRNYNNQNISSGGINNSASGILSKQLQVQYQISSHLQTLIQVTQESHSELTTIRSHGLKVKKAFAKPKSPRYSDYWESKTSTPKLSGRYGTFLERFLDNLGDSSPGISKAVGFLRVLTNPIQTARSKISEYTRDKINKVRQFTGDLNYKYQSNRTQLKKDAGLTVLSDEELNHQIINKILPEKLGELTDNDKEKINLLKNIYEVSSQSATALTGGKFKHEFKSGDTEKSVFDKDTGRYYKKSEYEKLNQSRINQIAKYWKSQEKFFNTDVFGRISKKINTFLDKNTSKIYGIRDTRSQDDIFKLIEKEYGGADPHELAKAEQRYAQQMVRVLSDNEASAARQFGPRSLTSNSAGKVIGFHKKTIADEIKGEMKVIVDDENGNPIIKTIKSLDDLTDIQKYVTDKHGNKRLKWAKHNRDGILDLSRKAKFGYDDLIYSDVKDRTLNPLRIASDLKDDIKDNLLSPLSELIHSSIGETDSKILGFIKKIVPKFKRTNRDNNVELGTLSDKLDRQFKQRKDSTNVSGFDKGFSFDDESSKSVSSSESVKSELGLELEKLKYFVINNSKTPLYVIDNELANILRSGISIGHIDPSTLSSIIDVVNSQFKEDNVAKESATDVGKELDNEKREREQQSRDSVQQEIADQLENINENLERNGGITQPQDGSKKESLFGKLFWGLLKGFGSGLIGLASLLIGKKALAGIGSVVKLFGEGVKDAIGDGLVGALSAGIGGLIKTFGGLINILKSGMGTLTSIFKGFSPLLGATAALHGIDAVAGTLGMEEVKEGQSTEDWQNENALPIAGMHGTKQLVSLAGHRAKAAVQNLPDFSDIRFKDTLRSAQNEAKVLNNVTSLTGKQHAQALGKTLAITGKEAGKAAAKNLVKKLPLVGALFGIYLGWERLKAGDYTGAALEVGSGIASLLPGAGTLTSAAIDAGLAVRDLSATPSQKDAVNAAKELSKTSPSLVQNISHDLSVNTPNEDVDLVNVKVSALNWIDTREEWISKFGQPTRRLRDGGVLYVIPQNKVSQIPKWSPKAESKQIGNTPSYSDIQQISDSGQNLQFEGVQKFHSGGLVPGSPSQEVPIIAKAGEYVLNERDTNDLGSSLNSINKTLSDINERDGYTLEKLDKPLIKHFVKDLEDEGGLSKVVSESIYNPPQDSKRSFTGFLSGLFGSKSDSNSNINAPISSESSPKIDSGFINTQIQKALAYQEKVTRGRDLVDTNLRHYRLGDKMLTPSEAVKLKNRFYDTQRYHTVNTDQVKSKITHDEVRKRYNLSKDDDLSLYRSDVGVYSPTVINRSALQAESNQYAQKGTFEGISKLLPGQNEASDTSQKEINASANSSANNLISGPPVTNGQLGHVSSKYESGGRFDRIGYDDKGGTSYGKFQIASNTGTFKNFLSWMEKNGGDEGKQYAAQLRSAGPANTGSRSGAVPQMWKELAKNDNFNTMQRDFIKETHYNVAYSQLNPELQKKIDSSPALQEVLWSTSVQHGATGGRKLLNRAFEKSGGSDEKFVNILYNERRQQFHDKKVLKGINRRFDDESSQVLALLGAEKEKQKSALAQGPPSEAYGTTSDSTKVNNALAQTDVSNLKPETLQAVYNPSQDQSKSTTPSSLKSPNSINVLANQSQNAYNNQRLIESQDQGINHLHAELAKTNRRVNIPPPEEPAEPSSKNNKVTGPPKPANLNQSFDNSTYQPSVALNSVHQTVNKHGGGNPPASPLSQQHEMRKIDPITQQIVDRLADNTVTNFSQAATNYAIGNNPMSVTHI